MFWNYATNLQENAHGEVWMAASVTLTVWKVSEFEFFSGSYSVQIQKIGPEKSSEFSKSLA